MEDFSAEGGGLPSAVLEFASLQVTKGWQVSMLQTHPNPLPFPEDLVMHTCLPSGLGKGWRWSPELKLAVQNLLSDKEDEIVHIHGVWTAPQWYATKYSRENSIPYVITPHGQMLKGVVSTKGAVSYLQKLIYGRWIAGKFMREASVLHAITKIEADVLHSLFPGRRVEVIPNGIDTKRIRKEINAAPRLSEPGRKTILFLGMLDPRKGIEILIHAFEQARLAPNWQLIVAGPDEFPGYRQHLSQLIKKLGCSDSVSLLGPVYEHDKWALYKRSDLFCLPSYSEVVGLVNLEAAMCGLPVITTPQTGLIGWEENGGVLVEPDVRKLSGYLRQAALWSDPERVERGQKLRNWVCDYYNMDRVDQLWVELYESVN